MDEALLGSIVQIADRAPALVIGRRHDPRTGRCEVGPRLHVRDRGRDQLGELLEAGLDSGRQWLGHTLCNDKDAPQTSVDLDWTADRRAGAKLSRAPACRPNSAAGS